MKYLESQIFESAMGAIICPNLILIIIEVDKEADCYTVNPESINPLEDCPTRSGSNMGPRSQTRFC
eukprot:9971376-Heterocapsa_arctica.AAC.1